MSVCSIPTTAVIGCYVVCDLPDCASQILWQLLPPSIVGKFHTVAHLLFMVNVAANFIVYKLFNKYLFKTIESFFSKCLRCAKPRGNNDDTVVSGKQSSKTATTAI